MQSFRNFLFYFSPLAGAAAGGLIGLSFNAYIWVIEVLMGFVLGCFLSLVMVVLSVRARFKSDPSLLANPLQRDAAADPDQE